jgi:AcrR family transcriptional regulator
VPRAGLSRAAVVDLAVQLVDDDPEGLAGLTLAAVAQKAGVAVPSLYKHVGSLAELRSAVTAVGLRELTRRASTAAIGVAGEEALFALGRAIRAFALEHPGLYAASQVAPRTDVDLMAIGADTAEVVAAVLRGFGLPPEREVDAVRATRAAVHGFVALEAGGGFGLPDDVERSFDALLSVLAAGIARMARS